MSTTVDYGVCENLRHMEQSEAEAVAWHEAMGHFKSDGERHAFQAAYQQGWAACRGAFALHADVSLRQKAREVKS